MISYSNTKYSLHTNTTYLTMNAVTVEKYHAHLKEPASEQAENGYRYAA